MQTLRFLRLLLLAGLYAALVWMYVVLSWCEATWRRAWYGVPVPTCRKCQTLRRPEPVLFAQDGVARWHYWCFSCGHTWADGEEP